MVTDWRKVVDELCEASADELENILPSALDEIHRYGAERAMDEVPGLLARIVRRLMELDAAKFANEAPEVLDKLTDFLWAAVGVAAEKRKEFRPLLESIGEMNVNIEASDSPFKSHFRISSGKLSGGAGLWRWKDQDFRYFGPTEQLMKILVGDVEFRQALRLLPSAPGVDFEGHPMWTPKIMPIMGQVIPQIMTGR